MRGLRAAALVLMVGCSQSKPVELGAEGGVLRPAEIPWAQLHLPPGALPQPAALFVHPQRERFPGTVGPSLEAGPHGTRFRRPVALRFSPNATDLGPGVHFGELKVATLEAGRWKILPTSFPAPGVVEGLTTHFSTFALVAPCHASGLNHDFPLIGCPTFSPRIETSSDVNLEARAFPVTVMLNIRPTPGAGVVDFTVSGLRAGWTYFLARDGSAQLDSLTTDSLGALRFAQDASAAHSLLLMAQHGSITLTPSTCPTIGVWEPSTQTCTLTQDYLTPPINLGDDNIKLDCAGHVVGGGVRASVGIVALRNGHSVRNCTVTNADVGINAFLSNRLTVADTTITMPDPSFGGGEAVILQNSNDVVFSNLEVSNFAYGMTVSGGGNLLIQGAAFQVSQFPIDIGSTSSVSLNDVVVDGARFGGGEAPLAAVQLSGVHGVSINRLSTRGAVTGVTNVVAATFDSDVIIADSSISQGNVALRLDGPGTSFVVRSTLSQNSQALQLNGGTNYVFHNNIVSNGSPAVVAPGPVDLFDNRPGSPTFQQGNFWGRACPDPLFVAGTDSNPSTAADLFPFGVASSWASGGVPGCVQPPPLAAPLLTAPANGALLRTGAVTFEGSASPDSTVEITESGVLRASGTASASGAFSLVASPELVDGPHSVVARARSAGLASQPSAVLSFVVDTQAPVAPILDFPVSGGVLLESSPFVLGRAEPAAEVVIEVDGVATGRGRANSLGQFEFRLVGVSSGAHQLSARATDAAGNISLPSVAVSVTVVGPGEAIQGSAGRLVLSSIVDAPDAFEALAGERNTVFLRGEFSGASGGAASRYELVLTRTVSSGASTTGLRTISTRTSLATPQGSTPSLVQGSVAWDGRDSAGQLSAPGVYLSMTRVELVRTAGGAQGCLRLSAAGCVVDTLDVLTTAELAAAPLLARPPSIPEAMGVARRALDFAKPSGRVLVVPESAFLAAVAAGRGDVASIPAKQAAVSLAGASADTRTLGVVAELQISSSPTSFAGEVFIVAREAVSATPATVETSNFYVAAVALSGEAAWVGTLGALATSTVRTVPGNCCSPQPTCTTTAPLPGPCGTGGYCAPPDVVTQEGSAPVGQGQLTMYGYPVAGAAQPKVDFGCTGAVFPGCTLAAPYCGSDRNTPTGPGNGGSQSFNGGCTSQDFGNGWLPPRCTVALTTGEVPGDCGGYCTSCGQLASTWWTLDGVHPSCAYSTPGPGSSGLCRPRTAAQVTVANLQALVAVSQSNCRGAIGGLSPNASCCGANCVCAPATSTPSGAGAPSLQSCTKCDGNNSCQVFSQVTSGVSLIADDVTVGSSSTVVAGVVIKPTESGCTGCGVTVPLNQPASPAPAAPPQPAPSGAPPTPEPQQPPPPAPGGGAGGSTADPEPLPRDPGFAGAERPIGPKDVTQAPATTATHGDPIRIGDGSLDIRQVDLSMRGAVRPLEFERIYDSQSNDRSTLGSNWTHNWDVRLQVVREGNRPPWVPLFCASTPVLDMCVIVHDRRRGTQLFALDYQTGLYMPQAGSTDTVARTKQGAWALRTKHGEVLAFNEEGYLVSDRDRFGNGFSIEYEDTPLGALYRHACNTAVSVPQDGGVADAGTAVLPTARCPLLAGLLNEGAMPDYPSAHWSIGAGAFPISTSLPAAQFARALYGRDYFLHLLSGQGDIHSPFGARRMRPRRVTDDMGRSLNFSYYTAPPMGSSWDFAAVPEADLLKEVRGPAGVVISFAYQRPAGYPTELSEMFLTHVSRTDSPVAGVIAAPARTQSFAYQWPGGPTTSWTDFATPVEQAYLQYFATFVGCWYRDILFCGSMSAQGSRFLQTSGNPARLARLAKQAFISRVADNIVKVTNAGVIESETRYETDPFSRSFDSAVAQRYGSRERTQDATRLPADLPNAGWEQPDLPRAAFAYASAGPTPAGVDATESFLPATIRSRYALEAVPQRTTVSGIGGPSLGSQSSMQSGIACNGGATEQLGRLLPGVQAEVPYFYAAPIDLTSPLKRTPLSCTQLAIAQTSNAAHNDLLSSLVPVAPVPGVQGDLFRATPVLDWRRGIASNVNRICAWTRAVDRDGDARYYGLNYRGQVLVDAVEDRQVRGEFIFTESLYTADGQLQQSRRPTRGATPWTPASGHTVYQYDEIDPRGNSGWNAWLAAWWTRRTNLIGVDEFPATGQVLDVAEGSSSTVTTSQARFQRMRYEPLFNQLLVEESGSIAGGRATTHRRSEAVFDYQELKENSVSAGPLLKHLESWGFRWLRTSASAYDYSLIESWQIQLPFFGSDKNGDGVLGTAATAPERQGVGLPIFTTRSPDVASTERVTIARAWTANGQPSSIASSEGQAVQFDYYLPRGLGSTSPPTAQTASSGNRGLLARVRSARYDDEYPTAHGPPGGACAALRGPYQWLLPSSCINVQAELSALGLPLEAVQAVLESKDATAASRVETVAFTYNVTGRPSIEWRETGAIRRAFDTDGRLREVTDLLGSVTTHKYNARAQRVSTTRVDSTGGLIDALFVQPDDEGLPLCECRELVAGACLGTCNVDNPAADAAVTRFDYTPEGQLKQEVDPEGMVSAHTYDERKLATRLVQRRGLEGREQDWEYTVDGDVSVARYGVSSTNLNGLQSERFVYDGLRRLSSYTNRRGVLWQVGHSRRDLLSLALRSGTALSAGSSFPAGEWKARFEYDSFERLIKRVDNDVIETVLQRTRAGNAFALSRTGEGATFITYDLEGKPLWRRDAAGTESVFTSRPQPHESTLTTLRRGSSGTRLATAVVQALNPAGQANRLIEVGGASRRETLFTRDGEGEVVAAVNPESLITKQPRNLAGWPVALQQQRSRVDATLVESSSYAYSRRGEVTEVTDPKGFITSQAYTAFGEVKTRSVPGTATVAFTYDSLGRLDTKATSAGTIRYDYDARGDAVAEVLLGGNPQNLITRTFDNLGRLKSTTNANLGLPNSLGPARQVTTRLEYDSAGRLSVDGQRFGTGVERTVTSSWSLASGLWQRDVTVSGAQGALWRETFDGAGRLAGKQRRFAGAVVSSSTFDWLGELPLGRSQSQGRASPFRQRLTCDSFGAPLQWRYTAIDLAGTSPVDAAEGDAYCGGVWNTSSCAPPLLQVDVLRDVLGRVGSLQWQYGNPVSTTPQARAAPWRGYTYSALSRLESSFEDEGVTTPVSTAALSTHTLTTLQVTALGAGSAEWDFERESLVGSTTAVREVRSGATRWRTTQARESYQLRGVEVDAQSRAIGHDGDGRLIQDGNRTYVFDVRGQLAQVRSSGVLLEALAYDGLGRLAAQYNGSSPSLTSSFQYDGRQMVQAVSGAGAVQWEAAWGPSIDSLLEWVDVAGGTGRHLALLDSRNAVAAYWSDQTAALSLTAEYNAEGRVLLRAPDGSVSCAEVGSGTTCPLPGGGPFGFSAAWRSSVTGLVSMRARWYSTTLGEFLSQDEAGYADSFNLYGFVGFDAINNRDPLGRKVKKYAELLDSGKFTTKYAKDLLKQAHERTDVEFEFENGVPLDRDGRPTWGAIKPLGKGSIKVIINEAMIGHPDAFDPALAVWEEVATHELVHAMHHKPFWEDGTPDAQEAIDSDELPAYTASLIVRRQLRLETDARWTSAHPMVGSSNSSGGLRSDPRMANYQGLAAALDQIRKKGTFPGEFPTIPARVGSSPPASPAISSPAIPLEMKPQRQQTSPNDGRGPYDRRFGSTKKGLADK